MKLHIPHFLIIVLLLTSLTLIRQPTNSYAQAPTDKHKGQVSVGTAFSYQGHLMDGGQPANGDYDLQFRLDLTENGNDSIGPTLSKENVPIVDGVFTVALDFGNVFDGTQLWLEVSVRTSTSTDGYTTLQPRQKISIVPFAAYAVQAEHMSWHGLTDVPASILDGDDDLDTLGDLVCSVGQTVYWNGTSWACRLLPDTIGDITAVHAGSGLTGGNTSNEATLNVDFAGTGSVNQVARSDHHHDEDYSDLDHTHVHHHDEDYSDLDHTHEHDHDQTYANLNHMHEHHHDSDYSNLDHTHAIVPQLPIGTILAWHKDMAGVPILLDDWAECNGQLVIDTDSPLHGQTLPNLNGSWDGVNQGRFLRGHTTSGEMNDDATALPTNSFATNTTGNHTHSIKWDSHSGSGFNGIFASPNENLVDGGVIETFADNTMTTTGDHNHVIDSGGDSETSPANMTVVWIIKIK
ncbi:MAG: hypothetical protein AAF629_22190 [Chloroflexota bacterium]